MYQVIVVVHVLLGLGLIGLILMQQGKGADAGAAFGSGSSGSVFGAQGAASFLSRTTAIFATLFFSTSLGLAVLSGHQTKAADLMDTTEVEKKVADVPLDNATAVGDSETPFSADETPTVVPAMGQPAAVTDTPATVTAPVVMPVPVVTPAIVDSAAKVEDKKAVDKTETKVEPKKEKPAKHKSDKKEADKAEKKHKSHKSDKKVEQAADKK